MEFPLQLKFFKKIDLYQEYKSEEYKFKISGTRLQRWIAEKEILKWTALKHHHLGSTLTNDGIKKEILHNDYSHAHEHAVEALIQQKYAEAVDGPTPGIKITKEGLLMGEVINEVENDNVFIRWKYCLKYTSFFALIWFTAIAGACIVIINFLKLLYELLIPIWTFLFLHIYISIK